MLYNFLTIIGTLLFLIISPISAEDIKLNETVPSTEIIRSPTTLPGLRGVPANLPDFSIIGDLGTKIADTPNVPGRNQVTVNEIEISFQGFLYPQLRADTFFAFHREADGTVNTELEEAYVSWLNLIPDMNLKTGRMLVDFGKLNKLHSEQWLFVDRPKVLTEYLGNHGLSGEGLSLSYLFPLPFFTQWDLSYWQISKETEREEESLKFGLNGLAYSSRLWLSFPVNEKSELEIGTSAVGSVYPGDVKVFGMDLTYRWWVSTYGKLICQNELLYLISPNSEIINVRYGYYNYLGYRFNKYWDSGIRYDWVETPFPEKEVTSSVSLIITKYLTELTRVRVQYQYNFISPSPYSITYFQLSYGIGPHGHLLN